MKITDEMVDRALETMGPVNSDLALHEALHRLSADHRRRIVRNALAAALTAMEREPIKDVLDGRWTQITIVAGPTAFIEYESGHDTTFTIHRTHGTGATIADAIRNALAAAKGDE